MQPSMTPQSKCLHLRHKKLISFLTLALRPRWLVFTLLRFALLVLDRQERRCCSLSGAAIGKTGRWY